MAVTLDTPIQVQRAIRGQGVTRVTFETTGVGLAASIRNLDQGAREDFQPYRGQGLFNGIP